MAEGDSAEGHGGGPGPWEATSDGRALGPDEAEEGDKLPYRPANLGWVTQDSRVTDQSVVPGHWESTDDGRALGPDEAEEVDKLPYHPANLRWVTQDSRVTDQSVVPGHWESTDEPGRARGPED